PALLAVLAGGLTVLGFAPFGLFPVPVLTLAILFGLWEREPSPRQRFWLGWLFGLGLFGTGVSWIAISIDQFGGVGPWVAVPLTLLFVAFLALYPGLAGGLSVILAPRGLLAAGLPGLWLGVEWWRGWFLSGFPWLSLGYSQIDGPLAGFVPLLGVHGAGLGVALSAGWLVLAARPVGTSRRLALGGLLLLWLGGYGLTGQTWGQRGEGETLRVALVQGNIPQQIKWQPEYLKASIDRYWGLTRAHWDEADLIVWPETALPDLLERLDTPLLAPLETLLAEQQKYLVLGIPARHPDGRYFNSILALGGERSRYDKRHLVPFGEFTPLAGLLKPLMAYFDIPMSDFSAGSSEPPLLRVGRHWVGASVCYEDAFGEETLAALPAAAFLINLSNDAWFGHSLAPHQHLEMARMRALESDRWLLRATNTGISALIDPQGRIRARSGDFETSVTIAPIEPRQGRTPYGYWGNGGVLGLALVLVVFYGSRRHSGTTGA
ncbi:MAG: apolipoprotein N-acyltransferase, partial [Pseudomonadota bacterium]